MSDNTKAHLAAVALLMLTFYAAACVVEPCDGDCTVEINTGDAR
jgi:hypothetical protein